jgi:hypothetical protein
MKIATALMLAAWYAQRPEGVRRFTDLVVPGLLQHLQNADVPALGFLHGGIQLNAADARFERFRNIWIVALHLSEKPFDGWESVPHRPIRVNSGAGSGQKRTPLG